jgi:tight adherence protein C
MISNNLIYKIYTKKSIERLLKKSELLGSFSKIDPVKFMNIRLILSIILLIFSFYFSTYGFFTTPILLIIFYVGLEYLVFDYRIEKRRTKLDYDALFFFEVLTLSLETDKDLKGALELTIKNMNNELSKEFEIALSQMKYGKTLPEALKDMKKKIPSTTINNIILNITESSIFGSSIIETLHNEVDYLRDKKILECKEKISKMPLKVSVISVIFFIPIILLLVLGPLFLNMVIG